MLDPKFHLGYVLLISRHDTRKPKGALILTIADRDKKLLDRKRLFVDKIAPQHLRSGAIRRTYREQLIKQIRFNIPPDSSVLEVGCGIGDTLAALEPSRGLGIDFSEEMIRLARKRHPPPPI